MDENLTELVFILDRSGSMAGLENDTIGGFNGVLSKQRKEPGNVLVSTVLFDDRYELLHDRVMLEKVRPMTQKQYFVRGCTALLDAVGKTITDISAKRKTAPKEERPGKTIFVIITDGYENASEHYDYSNVKHLIEKKQNKGWEFMFLGANMDAIAEASKLGIASDRAATYINDADGSQVAYECASEAVLHIRSCPAGAPRMGGSWKKNVDKDTSTRSHHKS